jgi:hypothetical protein
MNTGQRNHESALMSAIDASRKPVLSGSGPAQGRIRRATFLILGDRGAYQAPHEDAVSRDRTARSAFLIMSIACRTSAEPGKPAIPCDNASAVKAFSETRRNAR